MGPKGNEVYMLAHTYYYSPKRIVTTVYSTSLLYDKYSLLGSALDKVTLHELDDMSVVNRCLMVSTYQGDPSCFYFRISWILMEWSWFYFFIPSI